MNIVLIIILFGLVVLITHLLEGITGFGCTVLALPFCIMLVGLKTAVPSLIILAWILTLYIIIVDHKNIVWRQYFKILAFALLGLPIGLVLFSYMSESILKFILGIFMILVSIRGIYINFGGKHLQKKIPGFVLNIVLILGGLIHGAFGSGGPLVVIYATENLKEKSNFRATLCMLWFTLNTIILVKDLFTSIITLPVLKISLFSLPFLVVGMILGNNYHSKFSDKTFHKMIYIVLLISGIFMFI